MEKCQHSGLEKKRYHQQPTLLKHIYSARQQAEGSSGVI